MKKDRLYLPPYDVTEVSLAKVLEERTNWAFEKFRIRKLWEKYGQGEKVKVCILDTGCNHRDIKVRKFVNFSDDEDEDKCGHGTWISGCIKAAGGFLGLAPGCDLHVAKILNDDGSGNWNWMKKGLEWAKQEECQLINISAGGEPADEIRHEIEPILKELADLGVIIVAAAGNEKDIHLFPANDEHTIAVGATDRKDKVAAFSNFGPRMIAMAPGVDLLGCWLNNGYAKATGTSMSAPDITGILALVSGQHRLSLTEAIFRFAWTCKDLKQYGWDPRSGWGLVQPWKFMEIKIADKKINWAWIINLATFIFMYFAGDEEYRIKRRAK